MALRFRSAFGLQGGGAGPRSSRDCADIAPRMRRDRASFGKSWRYQRASKPVRTCAETERGAYFTSRITWAWTGDLMATGCAQLTVSERME